MADLWDKDADPMELGAHYTTAVDMLTRREVFGKADVATVIALHSSEIARLKAALLMVSTAARVKGWDTLADAACDLCNRPEATQ